MNVCVEHLTAMYSLVTSTVLCTPRTMQWLLSADVERSYLLEEETRISSYLHGTWMETMALGCVCLGTITSQRKKQSLPNQFSVLFQTTKTFLFDGYITV